MARVACGLELLRQPLPGKKEAIAFSVDSLLLGRDWRTGYGVPSRHFFLLLFDGFTFPTTRHMNKSYREG
jgi:hypothetical protein